MPNTTEELRKIAGCAVKIMGAPILHDSRDKTFLSQLISGRLITMGATVNTAPTTRDLSTLLQTMRIWFESQTGAAGYAQVESRDDTYLLRVIAGTMAGVRATRTSLNVPDLFQLNLSGQADFDVPFNPLSIPGCILWVKADSLALSDGAEVATWSDLSLTNNHATQATSIKRPIYKAVSAENGLPAVRFDGVNDILQLANELPAIATVFVAMATRAAPSNSSVIICDSGSTVGIIMFANLNGVAGYNANNNWGGLNVSFQPLSCAENLVTDQWNVLAARMTTASADLRFFRNGTQKFLSASNGSWGGPGPFSAIGGQGNEAAGTFLRADYGEIIVYNSVLSDPNRALVDAYMDRWT